MTRTLLALSLLSSTAALAQSLTLTVGSSPVVTYGAGSCDQHFTATYKLGPSNATYCNNAVYFYGSDSPNCGSGTDGGTLYTLTPTAAGGTGPFEVYLSALPGLDAANCHKDGGVNVTAYVCGFANYVVPSVYNTSSCTNNPSSLSTSPPITVIYQGQPPAPPDIGSGENGGVDELDGELVVNVSTSLSITTGADGGVGLKNVAVFYAPVLGDGGVGSELEADNSGTRVDITGLTNGVSYQLTAEVTDTAGNVSARSSPVVHTPKAIQGFFGAFTDAGGTTGGGCSTGGGAGLAVAGLALATMLRRKS